MSNNVIPKLTFQGNSNVIIWFLEHLFDCRFCMQCSCTVHSVCVWLVPVCPVTLPCCNLASSHKTSNSSFSILWKFSHHSIKSLSYFLSTLTNKAKYWFWVITLWGRGWHDFVSFVRWCVFCFTYFKLVGVAFHSSQHSVYIWITPKLSHHCSFRPSNLSSLSPVLSPQAFLLYIVVLRSLLNPSHLP